MSDSDPTIRATINGDAHELPARSTIRSVLARFDLDARHTAVERNRQLVPKTAFDATPIEDGDVLEIVTLVGGG